MKEKETLSDEELMTLYQQSDYQAFEILYKRHEGKIYGYLQKKLNSETAQEILQDVFDRVHRSRDKYNSQFPFLPWIFTVTRNTLFDYFKKTETRVISSSSSDQNLLENIMDVIPQPKDLPNLSDVLSLLPDHQKRAIELRYLNEWSFEKIAADLKTTPQNVRQIISRGIKKIKSNITRKG